MPEETHLAFPRALDRLSIFSNSLAKNAEAYFGQARHIDLIAFQLPSNSVDELRRPGQFAEHFRPLDFGGRFSLDRRRAGDLGLVCLGIG